VLGFFFLCKIVNEGNAKMLAQLENVWLTKATQNSVAPAEESALWGQSLSRKEMHLRFSQGQGQSLFRIPGRWIISLI
jgi:hypothetical protein